MATSSYARLGQAFDALATYAYGTAFPAPTTAIGFSISWTNQSGSTPGFFTFTSTTPAVSNQYNVLESLAAPNVPLDYVISQPEFAKAYSVSIAEKSSPSATLVQINADLGVALKNSIADMVYQVIAGNAQSTWNIAGNGGVQHSLIWAQISVINILDVGFIWHNVYNTFYNNATYPLNVSNFPRIFASTQVTVNPSASVVVNNAPPLDVDVTIQQPNGLFSAVSKTTTLP